jgi:hypothetical protein
MSQQGDDIGSTAFPPAGWVWRDEACQMFGVSIDTWKGWTGSGKVSCGRWFGKPGGGRRMLYPVEGLRQLMAELRGPDRVYRDPAQPGGYHVPEGYVRREEACRMFGITVTKWDRWCWTGRITCGVQPLKNGPMIYPVEELNRLVAELGRLAPPYPDPERPGVYRVPVHGWRMKRREVLIDADALTLIDGGRLQCPGRGEYAYVLFYTSDGRHDLLHRMILGETDPGLCVAHVNRDPLDCRRENLVVRTKSQRQGAARKLRLRLGKPPSSRFKGVSWIESKGKWEAKIHKEGRRHRLGLFHDEIAAAEAYDEKARELFGEHARLNFPDGVEAGLGCGAGFHPARAEAA